MVGDIADDTSVVRRMRIFRLARLFSNAKNKGKKTGSADIPNYGQEFKIIGLEKKPSERRHYPPPLPPKRKPQPKPSKPLSPKEQDPVLPNKKILRQELDHVSSLGSTEETNADSIRTWDPCNSSIVTEDPDNFCDRAIPDWEERIRQERIRQERLKLRSRQRSLSSSISIKNHTSATTSKSRDCHQPAAEDEHEEERQEVDEVQGGGEDEQVEEQREEEPVSSELPAELAITRQQRVGSYLLSSAPQFTGSYTEDSAGSCMVPDDESLEYSLVEPIPDDFCLLEDFPRCF